MLNIIMLETDGPVRPLVENLNDDSGKDRQPDRTG